MVAMTTLLTTRPHRPVPVVVTRPDDWTAFLAHLARPDGHAQDPVVTEALVDEARRLAADLPAAVLEALHGLGDQEPRIGAVLVKGAPVGDVPTTPDSPTAPTTKDRTSELVLLAVGTVLGEPIGYAPEHGGSVVQNLLPTPDGALRQTSTSSAVDLEFHTETAFHPHRPHHLLLVCLKGDPSARTFLCSVTEVLPHLDAATIAQLRRPAFRMRVDESFGGTPDTPLGPPVAVLSEDLERPTLLFDADIMTAVDPAAAQALDRFRTVALETRLGVALEPGDLLVVDNHVAIHGRSAFGARFDGTDRWLQRAFVVDELAPSAADRVGRIIDVDFDA